jgi:DNA topoisomerase-2
LNPLLPNGQYGSGDQGGKDHASARYISTKPAPIPRTIFHPGDDPLLNYLKEDKDHIKPEWYMPAIAIFLILINGAEGIGKGLSPPLPSGAEMIFKKSNAGWGTIKKAGDH